MGIDDDDEAREKILGELPPFAAHGDSVRVKHTLRPLGLAMAGRDVQDPYKALRAARAALSRSLTNRAWLIWLRVRD